MARQLYLTHGEEDIWNAADRFRSHAGARDRLSGELERARPASSHHANTRARVPRRSGLP